MYSFDLLAEHSAPAGRLENGKPHFPAKKGLVSRFAGNLTVYGIWFCSTWLYVFGFYGAVTWFFFCCLYIDRTSWKDWKVRRLKSLQRYHYPRCIGGLEAFGWRI